MPAQYTPGRYAVRVADQRFVESLQKKTPGFCLTFRVIQNLDQPETPVQSSLRSITWWLTPNTIERTLHDLHALGYPGLTLSGVDPDNPKGFHNFRDQKIELMCDHEEDLDGVTFERWTLRAGNPHLTDKSKIHKLDRILAGNGIDPNVLDEHEFVITDEDVAS
jgi:hypothetical protein